MYPPTKNILMKTIRILIGVIILFFITLSISSCKKEAGISRLSVYLTDAPADFDAVNIEVVGLQVNVSPDNTDIGWQTLALPSSPMVFNLLDFTNGMEILLSSAELPAGRISQLRLILGNNNTIVVNGVTEPLPLQVPSGQQSGLKFNIHANLIAGVEYKLWIDFDAGQSIVNSGTGGHILKPVIRTFTEATSGAIKGIAMPLAADATVEATNGIDIFSAFPDATTGEFLIRGIPFGLWTVTVKGNNGYLNQSVNNVSVNIGEVTDIGAITLSQ